MSIKSFKEFCNESEKVDSFLTMDFFSLLDGEVYEDGYVAEGEPYKANNFIKDLKHILNIDKRVVNTKGANNETPEEIIKYNEYVSKEQKAEALKLIKDTREELKSK